MHISSKNINASDLNSVYDYFDNVVNQLIRSEVDTENFPTLSAFALDLGEFIDKLDDLMQDINPRVEKYLANKADEERVQQEIADLQDRLVNLRKERHDLVGAQGDFDDEDDLRDIGGGGGVFSFDDDSVEKEDSIRLSPSVDIVFDTDIEDMMSDTSDLSEKAIFDDDAATELELRKKEEEEAIQDELMTDLYNTLTPLDVLEGKLEMHERGDTFDDLTPEEGLYDDDEEEDEGFEDGFSLGYTLDDDYHYEDDEEDDEEDDGDDEGFPAPTMPGTDFFDDSNDAFTDETGYDDDYDEDYADDYDDAGRNAAPAEESFDDDAWGDDDFAGPNIDQLLSSANMTI